MKSVLQDWVMELGLRHQGILVAAVRGCDGIPKEDPAKALVRALRAEFLVPAVPRPSSFIQFVDEDALENRMLPVINSFDHYPIHFLQHLMQAAEVIGYKKPHQHWLAFYEIMCNKLHHLAETEEHMDKRLNASEAEFERAGRANLETR